MTLHGAHVTEWIIALSTLAAAIIAAVTAWLAYRQYLQPVEQDREPERAQAAEAGMEPREIVVFHTAKQTTTLKVTARGLECHLEDQRPERHGHQWTLSPAQARTVLTSGAYAVNPGYKARSGLFTIGTHRNWLYSKALFPEPDFLKAALGQLLEEAAGQA
jgi:hypothetical protein